MLIRSTRSPIRVAVTILVFVVAQCLGLFFLYMLIHLMRTMVIYLDPPSRRAFPLLFLALLASIIGGILVCITANVVWLLLGTEEVVVTPRNLVLRRKLGKWTIYRRRLRSPRLAPDVGGNTQVVRVTDGSRCVKIGFLLSQHQRNAVLRQLAMRA